MCSTHHLLAVSCRPQAHRHTWLLCSLPKARASEGKGAAAPSCMKIDGQMAGSPQHGAVSAAGAGHVHRACPPAGLAQLWDSTMNCLLQRTEPLPGCSEVRIWMQSGSGDCPSHLVVFADGQRSLWHLLLVLSQPVLGQQAGSRPPAVEEGGGRTVLRGRGERMSMYKGKKSSKIDPCDDMKARDVVMGPGNQSAGLRLLGKPRQSS